MSSRPAEQGWLVWLLVVFACALVASVIGWKAGAHYARGANRETVAQLKQEQERTNAQWRRIVGAYANQGFRPGQLEWTASQQLTFTLDGKPLHCVGLLNMDGDVRSISCDWDGWRQG